jgi:hypothetical protein
MPLSLPLLPLESELKHVYLLQPRKNWLPSQQDPLEIDFEIHREDAMTGDKPCLTGTVDWQDGINFYYQQNIEPDEFSSIMACALDAIKEARLLIGPLWAQGEPK